MKTFTIHSVRNVFAFFIALGLGYVAYTVNPTSVEPTKVEAGASQNVSGWAYSKGAGTALNDGNTGIGWISFNSTTDGSATSYGVNVNTTSGDFSGTAWSSGLDTVPDPDQGGIGWISFDRSVTGNPPSTPYDATSGAIAKTDPSGNVTGWARSLAACTHDASGNLSPSPCVTNPNAGGWDGWIKLSDSTWTNGVKINPSDGEFSGYAYGGDVVGWVSFNCATDGTCGSSNYFVQGPALNCSNNAINPSACNQCADGDFYNTVSSQCSSCGGTGCSGTGGTTSNPFGSLSCNGGAINIPACDACQPLEILSGGACVSSVDNGSCDVEAGENLTNSPADCKPKTKFWQF